MNAIKAIYENGTLKPLEQVPLREGSEVLITIIETKKKDQSKLLDFFGIWKGENAIDLDQIMKDRENCSLGRPEID